MQPAQTAAPAQEFVPQNDAAAQFVPQAGCEYLDFVPQNPDELDFVPSFLAEDVAVRPSDQAHGPDAGA